VPALPLPQPPLTDGVVALRPWREADVAAVATWGQDPEIVRWTAVPVDQTADTVRAYFRRAERAREVGLFVALAIVDAESDDVIGSCDVRRPDPTDLAIGELGYVLIARARSRAGDEGGVAAHALGFRSAADAADPGSRAPRKPCI
jgi:[ribosomal protein S5]-alanine N-acetyltransferase